MNSSLMLSDVSTVRQRIDDSLYLDRLLAVVAGFFGVLSLLLAAIGIYGLIAFSVTQRTSEIGIRAALGATRNSILAMVVRQGLLLIFIGIVIGLSLSLASTRIAGSLLFGVQPRDPLSLAASIAVLLASGLIAVFIPARRATRIDPTEALRHE